MGDSSGDGPDAWAGFTTRSSFQAFKMGCEAALRNERGTIFVEGEPSWSALRTTLGGKVKILSEGIGRGEALRLAPDSEGDRVRGDLLMRKEEGGRFKA